MILAASLSLTPGSAFNSAAVAELRSTISALLGTVVAAGCANTGAAIVKARMPAGIRIYLNILISYFWRQVAVAAKNGLCASLFLIGVVNFWYYREIIKKIQQNGCRPYKIPGRKHARPHRSLLVTLGEEA